MFLAVECGRRKLNQQKTRRSMPCLPFCKSGLRGGDLCRSAIHLGVGHAGRARNLLFSSNNKPPSSQTKGLEVKTCSQLRN